MFYPAHELSVLPVLPSPVARQTSDCSGTSVCLRMAHSQFAARLLLHAKEHMKAIDSGIAADR